MKFKSFIIISLVCLLLFLLPSTKIHATSGITTTSSTTDTTTDVSVKKYGLVIADANGKYTFNDFNYTDKTSGIEISDTGNIMVPLSKVAKLIPSLKYSYNSKTKKATLLNTINGKKIIISKNSLYCYYYASSNATGVKKKMTSKMYVSSNTSAVMVHMSTLKWVMASTEGYKYYKISDMRRSGYDTTIYSGLIVYNPYAKITGIPKATNVIGISSTVKVTIPEGYSVPQVFELLVSKGASASTDFLYDALYNYDFSEVSSLVKEIPENENRCFLLEGYLYPDTIEFYRLSKGTTIINKLLTNTENRITEDDRLKAQSLGYSVDEILTIASLIEKEAGDPKLMPYVSSVIHNRLNIDMPLQLVASINYVERYIKPNIMGDINRYNEYYNTYKCKALPAGPICNPGKNAIQAALNPIQTDYYYFLSDDKGIYYFSFDRSNWVNPLETTDETK